MAATAVAPVLLAVNTPSASVPDASATVISGTGSSEGWLITPDPLGGALHLRFVDDGSGCTLTVAAGVRPPSQKADKGDLSFALTASQVKTLVLEPGRFLNAAGKIHIYGTDAGTRLYACQAAKGVG